MVGDAVRVGVPETVGGGVLVLVDVGLGELVPV